MLVCMSFDLEHNTLPVAEELAHYRNWSQLLWVSYQIRKKKLRVLHAPGKPGTFSPQPQVSDSGMHHGTYERHVPWCMLRSLTSDFLWSRGLKNVPGIPGACASRKFTNLVRGPCYRHDPTKGQYWVDINPAPAMPVSCTIELAILVQHIVIRMILLDWCLHHQYRLTRVQHVHFPDYVFGFHYKAIVKTKTNSIIVICLHSTNSRRQNIQDVTFAYWIWKALFIIFLFYVIAYNLVNCWTQINVGNKDTNVFPVESIQEQKFHMK